MGNLTVYAADLAGTFISGFGTGAAATASVAATAGGGYVVVPGTAALTGALATTIYFAGRAKNDSGRLADAVGDYLSPERKHKASVEDIVDKISDKYKTKFKCKEYAGEMEKLMMENDISGDKITINSKTDYIFSDTHGIISENGTHVAIKIKDDVYDNVNPEGIDYMKWLSDLGISDMPWMFDVQTSPIN